MKRLFSRLIRTPSLHVFAGLLIGQGAIFVSTPLLTRLYTPAQIGIAATFLACASIAGTLSTLRFELHIPIGAEAEVRWLARHAAATTLVISALSGAVFWLLFPNEGWTAGLFALTVGGLGGTAMTLQLAIRHRAFMGIAASKAAQGLGQVGVQLGAGAISIGHVGLQLGYAAGYALSTVVQFTAARSRRIPISVGIQGVSPTRKRYFRRQAGVLSIAALLNILAVSVYPLLILTVFGPEPAGQLAVAQRLAIAPVGMAVASLAPIILAEAGSRIRDKQEVSPLAILWLRRLALPAILTVLILLAIPEPALAWALGDEWAPVKSYLAAISVMAGFQVAAGPISQLLVLQGRARAQLLWDGSRLLVLVGVALLVAYMTSDPIATLWSASLVTAVFYVVYVKLVLQPTTAAKL